MSQRHEFVMLFEQDGVNRRELCRRFGISPTIGYRLWARYRGEGKAGLADRSRRPQRSPARTSGEMEERVLAVRGDPLRPGRLADVIGYCAQGEIDDAPRVRGDVRRRAVHQVAVKHQHGTRFSRRSEDAAPKHLLDRTDQPRMMAEETERLVVGVRSECRARSASLLAPDFLAVAHLRPSAQT